MTPQRIKEIVEAFERSPELREIFKRKPRMNSDKGFDWAVERLNAVRMVRRLKRVVKRKRFESCENMPWVREDWTDQIYFHNWSKF